MSGGGGSDFSFGGSGGGSGDGGTECDALQFTDVLSSPDPAVIATLVVGQELDVQANGQVVSAIAPAGRAGTLLNQMIRMIECLEEGHAFKAEVKMISGGLIRVHVHHA